MVDADRTNSWRISPRAIFWGATGGLLAAFLTGIPMHVMGMMTGIPADLVRSDNVWVGWVVHLTAGTLLGAAYGAAFGTRNYAKGALYGGAFGLLVGLILILLFANLITRGSVPMDLTGVLQVMVHITWGVVVGLVQASGLRADTGGRMERSRYRPA